MFQKQPRLLQRTTWLKSQITTHGCCGWNGEAVLNLAVLKNRRWCLASAYTHCNIRRRATIRTAIAAVGANHPHRTPKFSCKYFSTGCGTLPSTTCSQYFTPSIQYQSPTSLFAQHIQSPTQLQGFSLHYLLILPRLKLLGFWYQQALLDLQSDMLLTHQLMPQLVLLKILQSPYAFEKCFLAAFLVSMQMGTTRLSNPTLWLPVFCASHGRIYAATNITKLAEGKNLPIVQKVFPNSSHLFSKIEMKSGIKSETFLPRAFSFGDVQVLKEQEIILADKTISQFEMKNPFSCQATDLCTLARLRTAFFLQSYLFLAGY